LYRDKIGRDAGKSRKVRGDRDDVGVDQARQQHPPGQIDSLGCRGRYGPIADFGDGLALDQNVPAFQAFPRPQID
jgi:hypothetical protein